MIHDESCFLRPTFYLASCYRVSIVIASLAKQSVWDSSLLLRLGSGQVRNDTSYQIASSRS